MFLYRVKVEELDAIRLRTLKSDLMRSEETLRVYCPIREMSVEQDSVHNDLDICLALEDFIDAEQMRRLTSDLQAMVDAGKTNKPRVSSELIHF